MSKQPEISISLTAAQRKVVADLLPKFADRLKLDEKNARKVSFTTTEWKTIQKKAEAACPDAPTRMIRNSLRHVVDAVSQALEEQKGIGAITPGERIYQFKISLLGFVPQVWRRIQTRDCTLDRLHYHIQTAMGWTNSHLHDFQINDERYGDPTILSIGMGDVDCIDSDTIKVSELVPKTGRRFSFRYMYDFGDSWDHEILFEGCLQAKKGERYPLCLEGELNCPPEDIGGVWGYADFLEAIDDPKHERHEECKEWYGGFDPEKFDAGERTKAMRRGLPSLW